MLKRSFSGLSLKEAMELVPTRDIRKWEMSVVSKSASEILIAVLKRLDSFNLVGSEAAKVMLIDTLLGEIVPLYPRLKIWKGEPLESETVGGIADYLIAQRGAYLETPLLCAIEAKRDDFEAGQIQCIAEMAACRQNNSRAGIGSDVYGIVSNGQGWVFYQLTSTPEIRVTGLFTTNDLPTMLGALDHVCAACAANVP